MNYLSTIAACMIVALSFGQVEFKTGDSGLDAELRLVNTQANSNLSEFKTRINADYGISFPKIGQMLEIMKPGDIEISVRIGKQLNISVDRVIGSYKINKDKGWGAIAKDLGIKPGSPAFHALKGKPKKGNGNSGNQGRGNSKKHKK